MIKSVLICFFYALMNVSGTTLMKWKLKERPLNSFNDLLQLLLNVYVIGAFAIIFVSALILFKALAGGNFTFVIPVAVGINLIFTIIAGYYIFKEQLNIVSFAGFILIISGIILLSINNAHHAQ